MVPVLELSLWAINNAFNDEYLAGIGTLTDVAPVGKLALD